MNHLSTDHDSVDNSNTDNELFLDPCFKQSSSSQINSLNEGDALSFNLHSQEDSCFQIDRLNDNIALSNSPPQRLALNGKYQISDYIGEVPITHSTKQSISNWLHSKRELTRTQIVTSLVRIYFISVLLSFCLLVLSVFNLDLDKAFIQESLTKILSSETILLTAAIGFYFGEKKEKHS